MLQLPCLQHEAQTNRRSNASPSSTCIPVRNHRTNIPRRHRAPFILGSQATSRGGGRAPGLLPRRRRGAGTPSRWALSHGWRGAPHGRALSSPPPRWVPCYCSQATGFPFPSQAERPDRGRYKIQSFEAWELAAPNVAMAVKVLKKKTQKTPKTQRTKPHTCEPPFLPSLSTPKF